METIIKVFSGNANRPLAEEIARTLKRPLGDATVTTFSDGETQVKVNENVRGTDVFVVQPTNSPASNIIELLVILDAVRRASPRRVTAVIPYFGYARQDRKDQPRVAITAKLMANLISTAGADRILTMDLHSPQIQGFFDIPFDHLFASPVFIDYLRQRLPSEFVVVAPDIGSVKMARAYASRLNARLALVDKRRPRADEIEVMNVIGDVADQNVVIFDDIISTGSTLVKAAEAIKRQGARQIFAAVTHAVFGPGVAARIEGSVLEELVVTNTIHHGDEVRSPKIKVLSVGTLLGEAIRRIHEEESLSTLFV